MAVNKRHDTSSRIEGRVQLQGLDGVPNDLKLTAYVFDKAGRLAGSAPVDAEGAFCLHLDLKEPADVDVFIAPEMDPGSVRHAASYRQTFRAADWKKERSSYVLESRALIHEELLLVWWPRKICVSGHIRKRVVLDGVVRYFPVPFAKVEVFDVDREPCWWPYILKLKTLLKDRLIVRAEDLLAGGARELDIHEPFEEVEPPLPGPGPISFQKVQALGTGAEEVGFNPQPEPPAQFAAQAAELAAPVAGLPVGEFASLEPQEAKIFERLNIVAKTAPWILFPHCYYSRQEMCEDFTDCNGYFQCCFDWWPAHFRRGRLRFDFLPDIILKVTQVIDGVEKVIFMDPYSSTRWNSGSTHIDLYLDDQQIIHGPGCDPDPDLGECDAAILQLGRDELWKINKANGLYTAYGESNGGYGSTLVVRGDFSADLKDGSPTRYYLLSWAKQTGGGGVPADSAFTPVQTTMEAYRAVPGGTFSSYLLGPKPVGGGTGPGLYEVQDTAHWWIPKNMPLSTPGNMVLGLWPTASFESDEGTYWLRLEVFDQNGNKISSAKFCNYEGDGSGAPVPPTSSTGKLDVKVHVDNAAMTFDLVTPAVNACGVVPWAVAQGPLFQFTVNASQANGRIHQWLLKYNKGVSPTEYLVNLVDPNPPAPAGSRGNYNSGVGTVAETFAGSNMGVASLTTTCAYGLHLYAWSHVRVNYGWHYYGRKSYAIAIEKCG